MDCNRYKPVLSAKPFSPRKLRFMLGGGAKLDAPIQLADGVDHRNDGTEGPVKDQGQVGVCTAFSLSTAIDNAIRRQNRAETTSAMHLWSHYGLPYMESAGDRNLNKPIATWDVWPYDQRAACEMDQSVDPYGKSDADCGPYEPAVVPGTAAGDAQVQARIRDADSKGRWKVTGYDQLDSNPEVLAQYISTGADVWCAMVIGKTWFYLNGDTVADWTPKPDEGGHVVVLAGFRHKDGKRQFLVHNSWGTDWGDKGYAWISEGALSQSIIEAYKVTVADSSAPPSPPPTTSPTPPPAAPSATPAPTSVAPPADDPNALTDDDCAENQLVDAITGQCAEMCSDDSRPSNGQCTGIVSSRKPTVPAPAPPGVQ
ncbi:MAG: C1 family peptidase, partial [Acidimicrobiales bacterium]